MSDISEVEAVERTGPQGLRLFDCPDWLYLLREFDALYRHGSAGGSRLIRSHRKRVRETLSAIIEANPDMMQRDAVSKPVVAHLAKYFRSVRGR